MGVGSCWEKDGTSGLKGGVLKELVAEKKDPTAPMERDNIPGGREIWLLSTELHSTTLTDMYHHSLTFHRLKLVQQVFKHWVEHVQIWLWDHVCSTCSSRKSVTTFQTYHLSPTPGLLVYMVGPLGESCWMLRKKASGNSTRERWSHTFTQSTTMPQQVIHSPSMKADLNED